MKKKINAQGVNGNIEGEIVISMNYKTESVYVANHSTHDTDKKMVSLHKIECFVNGVSWKTIDELDGERMVENEAIKAEEELKERIEFLANHIAEKSFAERMKEKGFN